MPRLALTATGIAIALAVPAILAVTAVRLVTDDWYVRLAYDRGGVPADRYGLTEETRTELALIGLRSIQPQSDGVALLEEARLPSGAPAFNMRELRHMQDVRTLLSGAYRFQILALIAIVGLALLFGVRRPTRAVVPIALQRGALLTIASAVVVGLLSATSWGWFSTPFHSVFFQGETWRFAETDTLRRLYPDRFWLDTAIVIGSIAVLQALALYLIARAWARRAGTRQARGMRARTQTP